jgi:hypothetical protein
MENLVYFQTPNLHYIVCTPTRSSLTRLGILSNEDKSLTIKDHALLEDYAKNVGKVVGFPADCEFHNPNNPVRLFDFSERTQAARPFKILYQDASASYALLFLVGDALQEPFWPEGLGVNRGFHSAFDVAWTLHRWARADVNLKELLQERESMFMAQKRIQGHEKIGFEVLRKDSKDFSADPSTRYSLQAFMTVPKKPCTGDKTNLALAFELTSNKDICVQYEARMSQGKHVVLEDTKYSREVRVNILVLSRMMTFVLIHSCYFLRFSFLNSTVSGGIKKASRLFRKRWQRSPHAFVSSQKNEIARTSTEGKRNKRIGRSQPSLGVWIGWGEMGERHGP